MLETFDKDISIKIIRVLADSLDVDYLEYELAEADIAPNKDIMDGFRKEEQHAMLEEMTAAAVAVYSRHISDVKRKMKVIMTYSEDGSYYGKEVVPSYYGERELRDFLIEENKPYAGDVDDSEPLKHTGEYVSFDEMRDLEAEARKVF